MQGLIGKFFHPNHKATTNSPYRAKVDFETGLKLLASQELSSSWPNLYYNTIDALIEISQPKSILEIGVAYGWHAEHILQKFPDIKYSGVDPYLAHYDPNDHFVSDVWKLLGGEDQQESLDLLYELVSQKLDRLYGHRFNLYRTTSDEFFLKPKDKYDFIFVDGDHRYEMVLKDLESAWKSLAPGGLLCGDDYLWNGVRLAVTDFSLNKGAIPVLVSDHKNEYPLYLFKKNEQ